jgi:hypothetical protein
LTAQLRNLARLLWNAIQSDTPEKTIMMDLVTAVAIAEKFIVRGQNGLKHSELIDLLPNTMVKTIEKSHLDYSVKSYTSSLLDDMEPIMLNQLSTSSFNTTSSNAIRIPHTRGRMSNIAFDIVHRISHFIRRQRRLGLVEVEDVPVTINDSSIEY